MPSKAGSSAEGRTLILPDLSFDDEGVYECEAYNSEGSDTYQGRINVQGYKKRESLNISLFCSKALIIISHISSFHVLYFSLHVWFFLSRSPAQPDWLQVMSDSEVEISSELHWSCVAAGKPRPSVRWLRNGQPLTTQVRQNTVTVLYTPLLTHNTFSSVTFMCNITFGIALTWLICSPSGAAVFFYLSIIF